ncbi:hypothetical protein BV22DRAFT_1005884 [Leucogyrophana mollusca]|uniref:Uncharacterized protein n=1 Tax=Leucogyrophana mollusca TaxID=85980 RepID=A0ACB8BRD2_9AGAM|nr:hypothetical protein BV22DRAFT_1005884 [Leucogyrophana mollusca]
MLKLATKRSGCKRPKKSKMHQCSVCQKSFPRPSGLKMHFNSHIGLKPFKCSVPTCSKTFTVRSNARRHLQTHGINPSTYDPLPPSSPFSVDFEEPIVTHIHDRGRRPTTIKWVPQRATIDGSGESAAS